MMEVAVSLKRCYLSSKVHGVISRKTLFLSVTEVTA